MSPTPQKRKTNPIPPELIVQPAFPPNLNTQRSAPRTHKPLPDFSRKFPISRRSLHATLTPQHATAPHLSCFTFHIFPPPSSIFHPPSSFCLPTTYASIPLPGSYFGSYPNTRRASPRSASVCS